MPVNHADGTLFFSIVIYPFAAGKAALSAHAGWWTVLFILASLPVGCAVIHTGRKFIYWMCDLALGDSSQPRGGLYQVFVIAPASVAYFILPHAFNVAGFCSVYFGTIWLIHRFQ